MDRAELIKTLDSLKELQKSNMGIDAAKVIYACHEITRIRLLLRDDTSLFAHFASLASQPARVKPRRQAAR